MTDKIYGIVTGGEFTDTSVVGLFLEESDRDTYLEKFIAVGKNVFNDGARAVEFPLNPSLHDLSFTNITFVNMFRDGQIRRTRHERVLMSDAKIGFVYYVKETQFIEGDWEEVCTSIVYAVQTSEVAIAIAQASAALKVILDKGVWGHDEKTLKVLSKKGFFQEVRFPEEPPDDEDPACVQTRAKDW